ncbi:MAG: hypothetical protein ABI367_06465 [Mucilaginibacter sp.]
MPDDVLRGGDNGVQPLPGDGGQLVPAACVNVNVTALGPEDAVAVAEASIARWRLQMCKR